MPAQILNKFSKPGSQIKVESLEQVLGLAYTNLQLYCKTFHAESFYANFSPLHDEITQRLDSKSQKVAIAAPRGLGKTSLARALVSRAILYRQYEFVMYVSNSETVAELQTENIKRELKTTPEIRMVFGDIEIDDKNTGFDESFSKKSWATFGNTLILPRGAGQQVRGLLYKSTRPQLIIIDDLEKRAELENPENRRKLKEWFFSDLLKCVNMYDKKYRFIYIDTLKHADSLLEELLNDPEWDSVRLDLCEDTQNGIISRVPELISTRELQSAIESHRQNNTLDIFYSEYRNVPIAQENQGFSQEYFKYYDESELDKSKIESYIIIDPAKAVNLKAADSAIIGIGVNFDTGAIYIRDLVSGKMHPNELYEEMFDMRQRLNAHVIAVEVSGLEEFVKQPLENEMLQRSSKDSARFVWLRARGGSVDGEKGKLKRIGTLIPYYRNGHIYHNKSATTKLEGQLLAFPRGKLVDCADAEAYIIELLELEGRYFTTPDEAYPQNDEDEYADLEYELPLNYSRRI